jgi:hypothetical protein
MRLPPPFSFLRRLGDELYEAVLAGAKDHPPVQFRLTAYLHLHLVGALRSDCRCIVARMICIRDRHLRSYQPVP